MSEPPPTYTIGEQLDPATRDTLARYFEGQVTDAIGIIARSEDAMRGLGIPVQSVIKSRAERRQEGMTAVRRK